MPARSRSPIRLGREIVRGLLLRTAIQARGRECGPGLRAGAGTHLRWGGHPGIRLGANIRLGVGVILDVPPGGTLRVGDRVKVQHYTVIAAAHDLTIGDDTQIAEHCSIRDSDHGLEGGATIASQTISSKPRSTDGLGG